MIVYQIVYCVWSRSYSCHPISFLLLFRPKPINSGTKELQAFWNFTSFKTCLGFGVVVSTWTWLAFIFVVFKDVNVLLNADSSAWSLQIHTSTKLISSPVGSASLASNHVSITCSSALTSSSRSLNFRDEHAARLFGIGPFHFNIIISWTRHWVWLLIFINILRVSLLRCRLLPLNYTSNILAHNTFRICDFVVARTNLIITISRKAYLIWFLLN